MITISQAWLRGARAIHEMTGLLDPYQLRVALDRAVVEYLGPAIGMTPLERWERMTSYERELLVEALEERSAIMFDGKKPQPEKHDGNPEAHPP